jgi:6-phosphogluconolactonase
MATNDVVVVSGYAPKDQTGIYAFGFDHATGALGAVGSFAGVENPSFAVVHPTQPWLYAVSETSANDGAPGAVWALRFEHDGTSFERINQQASGGDYPCHLALDATNRWLLVSNYGSGTVGVLPVGDDGSLGGMTELVQHRGSGPNKARQEGPHAHSATWTPDNRFVIVADLGIDQLVMYAFDHQAGTLMPHKEINTRPGAGPRHLAFHPSGEQVYVANELANTVAMYAYDAGNGTLNEQQTLPTLPEGAPENTVADIHIAPDGSRVYVSNRGHNSIAVYDVAPSGQLALVAITPCGGDSPRNFALAPGGEWLLVANQNSNGVVVLPLNNAAEPIGAAIGHAVVLQPSCVQWVPAYE